MNDISHRQQHRVVRSMIQHDRAEAGLPPLTGEESRIIRRAVAAARREEQHAARVASGTARGMWSVRRTP